MPLKMCSGVDGERCGALFMPARDDRGRCPKCRAKNDKNRYDSRRAQGYLTRQWTKVAKQFLKDFPICADCRRERSRIAHHLHGLRPASPGGMDSANLVALCRGCHAKRHVQV
ncbi:MAG: HNH endonuclease signature motif containing protein [Thermoleophilaceae bacterium]